MRLALRRQEPFRLILYAWCSPTSRRPNGLNPGRNSPQDYLDGKSDPDLFTLQQIRVASLLRDLGVPEQSRDLIRKAEPLADRYGTVRDAFEEFRRRYP